MMKLTKSHFDELKKSLKLKSLLFMNATEINMPAVEAACESFPTVFVQQVSAKAFIPLNKKAQRLAKTKLYHLSPLDALDTLMQCSYCKQYKQPMLILDAALDAHFLVSDVVPTIVGTDICFLTTERSVSNVENLPTMSAYEMQEVGSVTTEDDVVFKAYKFTVKTAQAPTEE